MGLFAYYYAQTSSEYSVLKENLQAVCPAEGDATNALMNFITNESTELRQQIESNDAQIASLSSTRPAGYASTVAALSSQVEQDNSTLTALNSLSLSMTNPGLPAGYRNPCGLVGG